MVILDNEDKQFIVTLAENISGIHENESFKFDILFSNVKRLISQENAVDLPGVLLKATADINVFSKLISALTIHTTDWFREVDHFKLLEEMLEKRLRSNNSQLFIKALSAASASGEEVYSIAMLLQKLKDRFPHFDYSVVGNDIDPECIKKAQTGVYNISKDQVNLDKFKEFLTFDGDVFSVNSTIKKKCFFYCSPLEKTAQDTKEKFDVIFCRNVLIYLRESEVSAVVSKLAKKLNNFGLLVFGHCESLAGQGLPLKPLGRSMYQKFNEAEITQNILVVDDSALVRSVMKKLINDIGFSVIEASDVDDASKFLETEKIDLITLDVKMPGLDGVSWLKLQRQKKLDIPVFLVTEVTEKEADKLLENLQFGADDFISKTILHNSPSVIQEKIKGVLSFVDTSVKNFKKPMVVLVESRDHYHNYVMKQAKELNVDLEYVLNFEKVSGLLSSKDRNVLVLFNPLLLDKKKLANVIKVNKNSCFVDINSFQDELSSKEEMKSSLKELLYLAGEFGAYFRKSKMALNLSKADIILIGSSTGGTVALSEMLRGIGNPSFPPVCVVQHIPSSFQRSFNERLAMESKLTLANFNNRAKVKRGNLYMSDGSYHIGVGRDVDGFFVYKSTAPAVGEYCPSVDYLFNSAAKVGGEEFLAIILTGMGGDGAEGMVNLKNEGAVTMAQDPVSCVVFGMPREAFKQGGVSFMGTVAEMRSMLSYFVG